MLEQHDSALLDRFGNFEPFWHFQTVLAVSLNKQLVGKSFWFVNQKCSVCEAIKQRASQIDTFEGQIVIGWFLEQTKVKSDNVSLWFFCMWTWFNNNNFRDNGIKSMRASGLKNAKEMKIILIKFSQSWKLVRVRRNNALDRTYQLNHLIDTIQASPDLSVRNKDLRQRLWTTGSHLKKLTGYHSSTNSRQNTTQKI